MSEHETHKTQNIEADIGLTDFIWQQRNIMMLDERFRRIELPEKFAPEQMEMMMKNTKTGAKI